VYWRGIYGACENCVVLIDVAKLGLRTGRTGICVMYSHKRIKIVIHPNSICSSHGEKSFSLFASGEIHNSVRFSTTECKIHSKKRHLQLQSSVSKHMVSYLIPIK